MAKSRKSFTGAAGERAGGVIELRPIMGSGIASGQIRVADNDQGERRTSFHQIGQFSDHATTSARPSSSWRAADAVGGGFDLFLCVAHRHAQSSGAGSSECRSHRPRRRRSSSSAIPQSCASARCRSTWSRRPARFRTCSRHSAGCAARGCRDHPDRAAPTGAASSTISVRGPIAKHEKTPGGGLRPEWAKLVAIGILAKEFRELGLLRVRMRPAVQVETLAVCVGVQQRIVTGTIDDGAACSRAHRAANKARNSVR